MPLRAVVFSVIALTPILFVRGDSTVPVGYLRWTLPATTSTESRMTLSFPLGMVPVYSGPVASVNANTISVSGTPWAANAFSTSPYFVRFLSGAQAGRAIRVLANGTNTLTVDTTDSSPKATPLNTSGFAVNVGDRFEVAPNNTIASVFGDNVTKPLALVGAATEPQADEVSLYNPRTLTWEYYYFDTGSAHWVKSGFTADAGNTLIQSDDSVVIVRRPNRVAVDLTVLGNVPTVAPLTKVEGNNQPKFVSSRYPVPVTLTQLDFGSKWTRANSAVRGDTLTLWNDTLQRWETYYQRLDGTWRKSGDSSDQSNVAVLPGAVIGIVKRGDVVGATSFLSSPMPYTL